MRPQVIMAGRNLNHAGWDGVIHLAAKAAGANQPALCLGLLDMARRIEFPEVVHSR